MSSNYVELPAQVPGPTGAQGPAGAAGATTYVGDIDGGTFSSVYGGTFVIDGGTF